MPLSSRTILHVCGHFCVSLDGLRKRESARSLSLLAATNISLVLQNQNVLNGEEREEMAQGGYFKFQTKEMIEWGQEEKPQKIPGPKFDLQKIPCRISEP